MLWRRFLLVFAVLALSWHVRAEDAEDDEPETSPGPRGGPENKVATSEREAYLQKLIDALAKDDAFKVRLQAAVLLGRSSDERATPPLIGALNADAHYTVRAAAATALANLNELKAVSHILKAGATDKEAFVREEADRALGKYDRAEATPYVVATYNGDDDARVRKLAIEFLVEDMSPSAEPVILRALGDEPDIHAIAKGAVLKMERPRAMALLASGTDHREPVVRRGAVQVLHALRTPEAARLILTVYERDIEVEEVRVASRNALREMRELLPVEQFIKDAQQNPERYARARAIKLLGVVGGDKAEQVLLASLKDDEPYIRGTAVIAMQWLGSPSVVPALERLADDPSNSRFLLQIRSVIKQLRDKGNGAGEQVAQ